MPSAKELVTKVIKVVEWKSSVAANLDTQAKYKYLK